MGGLSVLPYRTGTSVLLIGSHHVFGFESGKPNVHRETQYRKVGKEPSCIRKPDTGQRRQAFVFSGEKRVQAAEE